MGNTTKNVTIKWLVVEATSLKLKTRWFDAKLWEQQQQQQQQQQQNWQ